MEGLDQKNYYELLGVEPGASAEEIRRAYHELAKIYHPDSNFYDEIVAEARTLNEAEFKVFRIITAAYNTLTNGERRRGYDATLEGWHLSQPAPKAKGERGRGYDATQSSKLPDWHSPESESFHAELLKRRPPRGFAGPLVESESEETAASRPRRKAEISRKRWGLAAWALASTLTTVILLFLFL